jgi:hypothetical protein
MIRVASPVKVARKTPALAAESTPVESWIAAPLRWREQRARVVPARVRELRDVSAPIAGRLLDSIAPAKVGAAALAGRTVKVAATVVEAETLARAARATAARATAARVTAVRVARSPVARIRHRVPHARAARALAQELRVATATSKVWSRARAAAIRFLVSFGWPDANRSQLRDAGVGALCAGATPSPGAIALYDAIESTYKLPVVSMAGGHGVGAVPYAAFTTAIGK